MAARLNRLALIALLVCAGAVIAPAAQAADCAALTTQSFAALREAPLTIAKAETTGNICRVDGTLSRDIKFAVLLPVTDWNGKYYQVGCSGSCGSVNVKECEDPVRRGYACLATDTGHSGWNWSFAKDNIELMRDYGHRGTHIAAIAGKAITAAFYGTEPRIAYFYGCSNGGRQALMEAEHFPDDFNGIIGGGTAFNEIGTPVRIAWELLSNTRTDGSYVLAAKDADLLHKAIIAACDLNDGIKDGLIGDPRTCGFDPASLRCTAKNAGNCLTDEQIAVANRLYGGPHDSKGRPIGDMGGLAKGSEIYWIGHFTPDWQGKPPSYGDFITGFFRYFAFTPPVGDAWQLKDLDFDKDPQRLGLSGMGFDADDPDLRRFKAIGGKLLVYQGWADISVVPGNPIQFYKLVTALMGGPANTRDFYRLFLAPGMKHCDVGGEGADNVDYTAAIEAWVEHGTAPDMLLGYHYDEKVRDTAPRDPKQAAFARPLFPYPNRAIYRGKGDANDPRNWKSVTE